MEEQELVVLYAKVRKPLKEQLEIEARLQRRTLASLVEVMLAEGLRNKRLRNSLDGEVKGHAV